MQVQGRIVENRTQSAGVRAIGMGVENLLSPYELQDLPESVSGC
jgi:hypothetical protein